MYPITVQQKERDTIGLRQHSPQSRRTYVLKLISWHYTRVANRNTRLRVTISPSEAFPFTNCVAVNPLDFPDELVHILINGYPLTVRYGVTSLTSYKPLNCHYNRHDKDGQVALGSIGISLAQRRWIGIKEIGAEVTVEHFPGSTTLNHEAPKFAQAIEIEVDFLQRANGNGNNNNTLLYYSAKDMCRSFVDGFRGIVMTTGQQIVFMFQGDKFIGTIKSVNFGGDQPIVPPPSPPQSGDGTGIILADTKVIFSKASGSTITIIPSVP